MEAEQKGLVDNLITKRPPTQVELTIHGLKHLGTEKSAEEFFSILEKYGINYLPDKMGLYEPIKHPYSKESAKRLWMDSKRNNPGYGGLIFKRKTVRDYFGFVNWGPDSSNLIALNINIKYVNTKDEIIKLIYLTKDLFIWADGVYGYGSHSMQSDIHYTPGFSYKDCLGGITWMALFGPPYVEMFGKKTLETAPCIVSEFAENSFLLLTSEGPLEANPEILEIQNNVQHHLGEDAFCKRSKAKEITLRRILSGEIKISNKGCRSPDFSKVNLPN